MPVLTFSRRASRQPVREVVLDRSNPLTNGLIAGYLPTTGRYFGAVNEGAKPGGTPRYVFDPKFGFGIRRADTFNAGLTPAPLRRPSINHGNMTILAVARPSSNISTSTYLATLAQNAAAIGFGVRNSDGTNPVFQGVAYIGGATRTFGGTIAYDPANRKVQVVAARLIRDTEQAVFVDGVKDPSTTAFTGATISLSHFGQYLGGNNTETHLILAWDRPLSDWEIASISTDPYQIFTEPPRATTSNATAASASLTGAAQAVAAMVGSLSTAGRITGSAVAQASANGTLSTEVRLTGAAVSQANGGGTLSTAVRFTGSAVSDSSASGALATQVRLAGAAASLSSAAGALSTSISLAGTAGAQSTASGTLAAVEAQTAALTAVIQARALASGLLTTSIALTGSAVSRSGASAVLTTGITLGGVASSRSSGAGTLMSWVRLVGSAQASASASGTLSVGVNFARAPYGTGYTPQRNEYQARPAQVRGARLAQTDTGRPSATQENYR